MTLATPTTRAVPAPPGLLGSALILAGRVLDGWRHQLPVVLTTWLFPVFVTLIFLGLFGGALEPPGGAGYSSFLLPGMLTVTMLFGLETTTLAAAADASRGINDRFRSFPISSAAIVLGRCLADLASSLVGLGVMVVFGLVIGWRPDTTPAGAVLALAALLLLRFALLWVGVHIGYGAASVESVAYVQVLVWPVALLSSVFVDPAAMPAWLGTVAELNPVSTTATTVRELLGTATWPDAVLPGTVSAVLAGAWPLVLTAVFLPLAARSFRTGRTA
ncbi:ABC transporter permease [Georgenia sp. H159]|uniref:ABC transporter permease n=1 Tax=Georgenia sp. H159 TaxID=3076115 RepID=UPI002D76B6E9|nr:ABC transporter permease [Georgenia sp. H159]